ncbi:hypothetical protein HanXRQr2_Chr04g0172951 [Helianthus annuus]|nr:hypothetical protein HanXRQr2_Chr04g0172951 [Helianthus annuus]
MEEDQPIEGEDQPLEGLIEICLNQQVLRVRSRIPAKLNEQKRYPIKGLNVNEIRKAIFDNFHADGPKYPLIGACYMAEFKGCPGVYKKSTGSLCKKR